MAELPVRHIHTLVCLAETGSFRRAAERLNLSQPAVSMHIRDLEGHFGVALVHRTTRRVSLTAEGEALAARARRAFEELEMASQDLRDLAAVHRGRVVVACIPPMMNSVIPEVMRRLATEYPAVEIEIRDVLSRQVEQFVERGDADFGIGVRPKSADLNFTRLMRDYFVVAMPADHALAKRETIALDEIGKYPLVALYNDSNARQIFDSAAQRLRQPVKPRFEVVYNFSIGRIVAVGLGLGVVPRSAIPLLGSDKLKFAEIRSPRLFREIGVLMRREYRPSPAARAFRSLFDDVLKRERPSGTGRR
jgi:LysR family transcriptional regulator, carnitine catabolism transcriptional activator